MALWHDQRVRAVVSAESEEVLFALGLCDGLGVARATLHYVVQPLFVDEPPRRGQRLAGLGNLVTFAASIVCAGGWADDH